MVILRTPEHLLAWGFGLGLSPVAPGTAGSLLALPVLYLAVLADVPQAPWLVGFGVLALLAWWICGASARLLRAHDHPGIVLDEVVGMLVAGTPVLGAFGGVPLPLPVALALAFVLFRLFDILKPWPISWFDRKLSGGFGILFDDLLAGALAAAVLAATRWMPAQWLGLS